MLPYRLVFGLFFIALQTFAQQNLPDKPSLFVAEVQYSAGKVMPVYGEFPKTTFANAAEIHLGWQTNGSKVWHKMFNYPRLGLSLIYQELGNPKVMGQQISVVPTVYFRTGKKEDAKVFAEFRYGLGLACFTRTYHAVDNPKNFGVSSAFTWQYTVGANLRWRVSQYINLNFGGVWYHASNAHTQLPNVGVNTFSAYVGLLVYPTGKIARVRFSDTTGIDKRWHLNVRFGSGWHEMGHAFGPVGGKKYPVYTGAIYTSRKLAKVITAKMGFMYRYYPLYREFLQREKVFDTKLGLRSSAFIVFLGADFLLGHFAISLEAGVNLYKPAFKSFHDFYETGSKFSYITKQYLATRFGLNYYILDPYKHPRNNVFLGAYVSANSGQAEFLELNIGYVW